MTYRRVPTHIKLVFQEPNPLAGLTITTRAVPVKDFVVFGIKTAKVHGVDQTASEADQVKELEDVVVVLDELRTMFAEYLIEWDMEEEDGSPTPATLDGVRSLDDTEFFGILNEWMAAIGGVDEKLGKGSTPGAIPALADLMEPISQAS